MRWPVIIGGARTVVVRSPFQSVYRVDRKRYTDDESYEAEVRKVVAARQHLIRGIRNRKQTRNENGIK